jgi:hypothetical protein
MQPNPLPTAIERALYGTVDALVDATRFRTAWRRDRAQKRAVSSMGTACEIVADLISACASVSTAFAGAPCARDVSRLTPKQAYAVGLAEAALMKARGEFAARRR